MMIKKILKYLAIFLGVILLLWSVVVGLVLTPEVLTPRLTQVAQNYVKSDISIKSVDLSLFTRFPNVTLRIDSLRITQTNDTISDLLFARECRVAIDPVALLFKNVVVNHFSLRGASLYVYVDEQTGPLKTFNLPSEEPLEEADSLSSFEVGEYTLSVKRCKVDSLQITIDDRTRRFYTRVDDYNLDLSMNLSSKVSNLDLKTGFSNLIVWNDGDLLVKKTSLDFRSKMLFDLDSMALSFDKARIMVNGIDLKARGTVRQDSLSSDGLLMDVRTSLNTPSLAEFLELIPSSLLDGKDKITTKGSVALDLEVKGLYSPISYPTVAATLKVDDAVAKYASRKLSLEEVSCDAYAFVDVNNPKSSYAQINSMRINTSEVITLDVSGKVTNIVEDPTVDLSIFSEIDFDRFTEVFPLDEAVVCSGNNKSNIKTQFALSDITEGNYANLVIDGESIFENLGVTVDASKFIQDTTSLSELYMQAQTGRMLFGDNIRKDSNSRTLRSKMNFSGIGYKSKAGEFVRIKDIELTLGASFDRSTSAINGMGIRGLAQNMHVGIDSLFTASLESSDVSLIVKPKNENAETRITANINSQQITVSEPTFGSQIALSSVLMDVALQRYTEEELEAQREAQRAMMRGNIAQRQGRGQGQGQGQPQAPKAEGDGERASEREGERDPRAEGEQGQRRGSAQGEMPGRPVQQKWSMNGSVAFADLDMITEFFPLAINVPETSVTVSPGNIELKNTRMMLGSSEIVATGNVSNLIRKMFIDPRTSITGALSVTSPFVNFNELLEASNQSVLMLEEITATTTTDLSEAVTVAEAAEAVEAPATEVTTAQVEEATAEMLAQATAPNDRTAPSTPPASALFLVPRRMELALDLNIDKALFEEATIENVRGHATVADGALTLDELTLNAIGADASGSVIYRNSNRTTASVAANMNLVGVDINRIGELLPEMISMFPMLQSFEGNVTFDCKVNADMLSDGNIDVSTLRSAMMFKGVDMVLMDSETFDDLSKTLMFKNKDRNIIESIEAFALVDQSKVDVLPFEMTIDRYQAIIGGSQVIDPVTFGVDYEYNVSIIKSPLPFKAGVDITGDLEDFKFKVTTAKLKNTDFDEQRAIYEQYRDGIE